MTKVLFCCIPYHVQVTPFDQLLYLLICRARAAEVLTGDSPAVALPPSQALAFALELVVELTVRAQITVDVLPLEGP